MMEDRDASETVVSQNFNATGRKQQMFGMFVGKPEEVSNDPEVIKSYFGEKRYAKN